MSNLWSWSARRLHDEFVQGAVSAETIVMAHLNRIEAIDSTVKAFLFVDAEGALQEARRQERDRRSSWKKIRKAFKRVDLEENNRR